jgi:hypothetical protein
VLSQLAQQAPPLSPEPEPAAAAAAAGPSGGPPEPKLELDFPAKRLGGGGAPTLAVSSTRRTPPSADQAAQQPRVAHGAVRTLSGTYLPGSQSPWQPRSSPPGSSKGSGSGKALDGSDWPLPERAAPLEIRGMDKTMDVARWLVDAAAAADPKAAFATDGCTGFPELSGAELSGAVVADGLSHPALRRGHRENYNAWRQGGAHRRGSADTEENLTSKDEHFKLVPWTGEGRRSPPIGMGRFGGQGAVSRWAPLSPGSGCEQSMRDGEGDPWGPVEGGVLYYGPQHGQQQSPPIVHRRGASSEGGGSDYSGGSVNTNDSAWARREAEVWPPVYVCMENR